MLGYSEWVLTRQARPRSSRTAIRNSPRVGLNNPRIQLRSAAFHATCEACSPSFAPHSRAMRPSERFLARGEEVGMR